MKHRIVTEDQNDEDVIEWKFEVDEEGYPTLSAKSSGFGWRKVVIIAGDEVFTVGASISTLRLDHCVV